MRYLLLILSLGVTAAQAFPTKPVKIIVAFPPGGGTDIVARVVGAKLQEAWGQGVVVENRAGASGTIGTEIAAKSEPDGHTLFMATMGNMTANQHLYANMGVDPLRAFAPITKVVDVHFVFMANPALPAANVREVIALAKQKPGELAYGTNGRGRLTHLTGELLATRAGIKLQMVPYSGGTAQVINDIMGKRIPLLFEAYSGIAGAVTAGNLRPLAVAAPKRVAEFPDLPTVAETLPGFEAGGWLVIVAPPGTPAEIVAKANAALVKAVQEPETAKRIAAIGWDQRPLSPAETLGFIHAEQQKWAPILKLIAETH
jgi:tripartite-type tricarboxylate transporter receptor subunit TctC